MIFSMKIYKNPSNDMQYENKISLAQSFHCSAKAEQLLFLYVATYNNKVTWPDGQCIVHILFSNMTFSPPTYCKYMPFIFYITFFQPFCYKNLKRTFYQIYILLEGGANRTVWTVAIRPSKFCIICSCIKSFH